MSPEDRLSLYIDAVIEGRRPPRWEGDHEWELLLETVRRVRRLAPPAMPEPDFPQRLAAALSHQLGGRRAGVRWGLRRMTVFLGTAAAVLVLCFASYGYGRWSVEGRWPWWPSPPAETARGQSALEPGAPERPSLAPVAGGGGQERVAVRQEASQPAFPSGTGAATGNPGPAPEQGGGGPQAAYDRQQAVAPGPGPAGPFLTSASGPGGLAKPRSPAAESAPAAGPAGEPGGPAERVSSMLGSTADRGGAGTGEGSAHPVAPAAGAPEEPREESVAGRAGEGEGRPSLRGPETHFAPAGSSCAAKGAPAAGTGLVLLFGEREYRAVEVVEAGALATTTLELVGEGRARGLPDRGPIQVYRRPDSVPTEVYTPLGGFWVRWAPAEPSAGGSPFPEPR